MMLLELRESAPAETVRRTFVKVSNPDDPREFAYVEQSVYHVLVQRAQMGFSGFLDNLWGAVKGAVGGFVGSGGSITGAIAGGVQGYISTSKTPPVAVSQAANTGAASITVPVPPGPVPAVILPTNMIGQTKAGMNPPGTLPAGGYPTLAPGSMIAPDFDNKKNAGFPWGTFLLVGGGLYLLSQTRKRK